MRWILSSSRLAVPLVGALIALAVALYLTCRPGWRAVESSLVHGAYDADRDGPAGGPIWHAEPGRVPPHLGNWRWDRHPPHFVPLPPCEARNVFSARTYLEGESWPVVLNAVMYGTVVLHGHEYPLPDDP